MSWRIGSRNFRLIYGWSGELSLLSGKWWFWGMIWDSLMLNRTLVATANMNFLYGYIYFLLMGNFDSVICDAIVNYCQFVYSFIHVGCSCISTSLNIVHLFIRTCTT